MPSSLFEVLIVITPVIVIGLLIGRIPRREVRPPKPTARRAPTGPPPAPYMPPNRLYCKRCKGSGKVGRHQVMDCGCKYYKPQR
jgi:hypothetical protein